ncbi:MAG: hypothetical protein RBS73_06305 [Prolixibacteraceae bacterium]|jgi:hypothetical protein|nr:hypothetical protein [Prolixibacteraceae bacterium]
MNKNVTRRSFVTTTLSGMGALAVSNPLFQCTRIESTLSGSTGKKQLFATTDYFDNVLINHRGSRYGEPVPRDDDYYNQNRCFMDRQQLDELHQFLASVGVTRHQWMFDITWTFYEDYPHGFDLLKEVAASAHRYGIELYAVIKPFEGGGFGIILPHSMPCPAEAGAMSDLRGIFPSVRRFVAANPALSLKRREINYKSKEPVSTIRLVKSDNRPTRINAEHLSIWTSATNNRFVRYDGPVSFRETIEKRYRFPYWRQSRVLHLENLAVPAGHRYFLIKCSLPDGYGDFSNEKGNIIELADAEGNMLPHTLSSGPVSLGQHNESFYQSKLLKQVIRYLQHPQVQAEISDRQKMEEHYRDFYVFSEYNLADIISFNKQGYVAVVCGKPEYLTGQLNPVHPEVREHWLDMVRFCLDRGVDGINIRASNHTLVPDGWEYGFNEPVLKASNGKTDFATISRINGNAYTLFLREAKKLVKSRGKSLAVHLETELLMPDDRPGKLSSYPYNFEWQWESWVKEIGDEFEIRGIFQLRPWNFKKAVDIFSAATQAAGKPLYLQGDFHGMAFDGPFASMEAETEMVKNYPGLDGYVFYETANITWINENGEVEGSAEAAGILTQFSRIKNNKTQSE